MKKLSLIAAGLLLVAAPAFAQTTATDPVAAQRDANQQQRIEQGEASGQLTGHEAAKLEKQEGRLDKQQARMEKNGVTPAESAKMNREQNRESKRIYNQKHDAQVQTPAPVAQ